MFKFCLDFFFFSFTVQTGIGYAVVLIAFYVDFYYNVVIAWALYFFFASFSTELPWTRCSNNWNTVYCEEIKNNDSNSTDAFFLKNHEVASQNRTSPALEYFK